MMQSVQMCVMKELVLFKKYWQIKTWKEKKQILRAITNAVGNYADITTGKPGSKMKLS